MLHPTAIPGERIIMSESFGQDPINNINIKTKNGYITESDALTPSSGYGAGMVVHARDPNLHTAVAWRRAETAAAGRVRSQTAEPYCQADEKCPLPLSGKCRIDLLRCTEGLKPGSVDTARRLRLHP